MNTSPGALLLLLLALYLGGAYFTGRLEWLFAMGRDLGAGYRAQPTATAPVATPAATAYQPRYRYANA